MSRYHNTSVNLIACLLSAGIQPHVISKSLRISLEIQNARLEKCKEPLILQELTTSIIQTERCLILLCS